jgi:hypothetical protein
MLCGEAGSAGSALCSAGSVAPEVWLATIVATGKVVINRKNVRAIRRSNGKLLIIMDIVISISD